MNAFKLVSVLGVLWSWCPIFGTEVLSAYEVSSNGAGYPSQDGPALSFMVDQPATAWTSPYAVYHVHAAVLSWYWQEDPLDPSGPGLYTDRPVALIPSVTVKIKTGAYNPEACFTGDSLLSEVVMLTEADFVDTGVDTHRGVSIWELNVYFSPITASPGDNLYIALVFNIDMGTEQPLNFAGVHFATAPPLGSLSAWTYQAQGSPECADFGQTVAADLMTVPDMDTDGDTIVDMADLSLVIACLQGPGVTTPPPGLEAQFALADLDNDGDVDLHDFRGWQLAFMGNVSP